jgi:hypothetical protein
MPTIEPLSQGARAYLQAFDLRAVCQTEGGRIFISDNPKGAAVAYWCRAADASRVAETAWQTGDILAAGQQCGVGLTPHQIVLKRVGERTNKIDEEIAKAIDAGVLKKFNAEYRTRRIRAKQRNQDFMSYSTALRRLRELLARCVARGGEIPASFIASVFDEASRTRTRKRDGRSIP